MEFTKEYYEDLLYKYLLPFITLYDNSESSIIIPNEIATSYEVNTMRLESFSRSLLGWSFLKGYEDVKRIILSMIKNGVNCNCNKYWGKLHNNDQKIVEMFPILLKKNLIVKTNKIYKIGSFKLMKFRFLTTTGSFL